MPWPNYTDDEIGNMDDDNFKRIQSGKSTRAEEAAGVGPKEKKEKAPPPPEGVRGFQTIMNKRTSDAQRIR